MIVRAIRFRDVRVEDIIRTDEGVREVMSGPSSAGWDAHGRIAVGLREGCSDAYVITHLLPDTLVELLHRSPLTSQHQLLATLDATAERMQQVLRDGAEQHIHDHLEDPVRAIAALRDALDAYELSKPPQARAETWWQSRLGPHNL